MSGKLEPCKLYGGDDLPPARFAPDDASYAEIYWRNLQTPPLDAGQAVEMRGGIWLIENVQTWQGHPGGTHAKARMCDVQGHLHRRTTKAITAYGTTFEADPDGIPIIGVLGIALADETGGRLSTMADLTPVGVWQGHSGDLVVFTDGTRWEQLGDDTERTTAGGTWAGRKSRLPVIHLKRVRDGATVIE
jgi:hypothetical protein